MPKILDISLPSAASSVVFDRLGPFGSAVEVASIDELTLMQDIFERNVVDLDGMVRFRYEDLLRRQSLLVIKRISNQANLGHPCLFYLRSLYKYASDLEMSDLEYEHDSKYSRSTLSCSSWNK
jgi:hypothetical protein